MSLLLLAFAVVVAALAVWALADEARRSRTPWNME